MDFSWAARAIRSAILLKTWPRRFADDAENKMEYCENCGKEMAIKRGQFGAFLACTGYPDCKTTRRLVAGTRIARQPDEPLDEKCPL